MSSDKPEFPMDVSSSSSTAPEEVEQAEEGLLSGAFEPALSWFQQAVEQKSVLHLS